MFFNRHEKRWATKRKFDKDSQTRGENARFFALIISTRAWFYNTASHLAWYATMKYPAVVEIDAISYPLTMATALLPLAAWDRGDCSLSFTAPVSCTYRPVVRRTDNCNIVHCPFSSRNAFYKSRLIMLVENLYSNKQPIADFVF